MERIERIMIAPRGGRRRAQVTLRGMNQLPAATVLEAAEQLRQAMRSLHIASFSMTAEEVLERRQNHDGSHGR